MLERTGSCLKITAPMLFSGASALLVSGRKEFCADITEIDLSDIGDADSSALAVLFALLRDAKALNSSIRITNSPAGLVSLAALYGVSDFLPLA